MGRVAVSVGGVELGRELGEALRGGSVATPRKHWCKLFDSILREDWDDATLATVVRLMAWLNQRLGRDGLPESERGHAVIGAVDAMLITRKSNPGYALKALTSLPDLAGISATSTRKSRRSPKDPGSDVVEITWAKYAEENRVTTRELPKSRPGAALSETETETDTEEEEEESAPAEAAPAEPPPAAEGKRRREPKPVPPEATQFAADFLDGLRAIHAGFQGPGSLLSWAREARLMLAVRPLDEARDLARWLFEDTSRDADFWRTAILSVPKFRQQYDRLLVVRRRAPYAGAATVRPGPISQAIRELTAEIDRKYGPH